MTTLEIAVENVAEAIAAEQGGANSVEVSRDLAHDGLTPALSLVQQIVDSLSIDVHVIVRPHDRDFVYDDREFESILADTTSLVHTGVNSIVFGAHSRDGQLNVDMIRAVAAAAHPVNLTLHRAIDSARFPEEGLQSLSNVLDRVLTAGPAATAWEGREGLRAWQRQFNHTMNFIAAGSIRVHMLPELVQYTGVGGIHVGSAVRQSGIVSVSKIAHLRHMLDSVTM